MSRGKLAAIAAAVVVAVALVAAAVHSLRVQRVGPSGAGRAPEAVSTGARGPLADGFAGSGTCAECHAEQHDAWSGSTHGRAGGAPGPETIVAPFDGTPIVFSDARVTPAVEASGAYVFLVDRPGRARERFVVDGVVGRGHMLGGGTQGFVSAFEDGTVRFLPFDFSVSDGTWFCNTAPVAGWWISGGGLASLRPDDGWIPVTPEMKLTDCGDWPPIRILGTDDRFANCQECHGSQIRVSYDTDAKRYRTSYSGLDVNCESCHGPLARHVEMAREGFPDGEAGLESLAFIDKDASIDVCLQCHALKRRLRLGYLPGAPLEEYFSLKAPLIGDRPFTPDGRVRTFAYQQNHFYSPCYYAGPMTCVDCHDPHGQGYRDQDWTPLSGPFDDGQCTGCHAAKLSGPEHTFHEPGSEGAGCVACHMPYLQQPVIGPRVSYARSDHSISIPRPLLDEQYGIEGACRQCHQDRSNAELQREIEARWGVIKPLPPVVEALVEAERDPRPATDAEARALLAPGGGEPIARVAALNHLFDEYFRPGVQPPEDVVERLRSLAGSEDVDVAATALAALDLTSGDDLFVRAFLDEALRGPDADRLRRRWALVLTLVADLYRRAGEIDDYVATMERGGTVLPDDSETLVNVAAAYAETGRADEAIQHYIRAVQLDEHNSVALVNLAVLLESLGREDEAETLYRQALDVRPIESLAWVNLGNALLRRAELAPAIAAYDAAVRQTEGMPLAHFYKAIAHLQLGEIEAARVSLLTAAEFAPDDPQIAQLLVEMDSIGG